MMPLPQLVAQIRLTGEVTGESISITGTGSVTDKNVGSGNPVIYLVYPFDSSFCVQLYNWNNSFATHRDLSISGEKVYDGTETVLAYKLIPITLPEAKHLDSGEEVFRYHRLEQINLLLMMGISRNQRNYWFSL